MLDILTCSFDEPETSVSRLSREKSLWLATRRRTPPALFKILDFVISMPRKAFTFIEVLISLFMMTAILGLVAMSIDINLRNMVVNRTEVEEAQLARAVLEKIAKDIRSVVVALREEELEVDTESLSTIFSVSAGIEGLYDYQASETESSETSDETTEETEVYGTLPGIYGDLNWIQIDTAKLPRGEMFGSKQDRSAGSILADRLSPSKTILYYLGEDTGQITDLDDPRYQPDRLIGSLGRSQDRSALRYGLFRRQLDRMVSQYALNEGLETEYEQYDEILAPEVENVEFEYFDPTGGQQGETGEWIEYWDMDEMQTLPTAVRITVSIRRQSFGRSFFSSPFGDSNDKPKTVIYSLVVPIPITLETTSTDEETE